MDTGEVRKAALLRIIRRCRAAFERRAGGGCRQQPRAGHALQRTQAAGMIDMLVAREQQLNIGRAEAQAPDVGDDRGRGFGRRGIDQDVALLARHQQYDNAAGSNVIDVAEDADGGRRVAPALLACTLRLMLAKARRVRCEEYFSATGGKRLRSQTCSGHQQACARKAYHSVSIQNGVFMERSGVTQAWVDAAPPRNERTRASPFGHGVGTQVGEHVRRVVDLTDVEALRTQDRIGRHHVEVELRQRPVPYILLGG